MLELAGQVWVILIAMFSNIVHITPVVGTPLKSDFHGTIPDRYGSANSIANGWEISVV
jgi:hypothetical protein